MARALCPLENQSKDEDGMNLLGKEQRFRSMFGSTSSGILKETETKGQIGSKKSASLDKKGKCACQVDR